MKKMQSQEINDAVENWKKFWIYLLLKHIEIRMWNKKNNQHLSAASGNISYIYILTI